MIRSNAIETVFLLLVATIGSTLAHGQQNSIQPLFDGKSLEGWQADEKYWRVENGAIVGEIPAGTTLKKNTWLVWQDGQLSDFELRVRFKLSGGAGANSGIQIRCQVENVEHVSGYQADLDLGQVWLGRVYDEHGRALLVERGSRVHIAPDGTRQTEVFAPAAQYAVLFRENAWNEYRIVAVGDRMDVYVNGTLFSQLKDEQTGHRDLAGGLAFQLHSGGETRIEFRDIQLETLAATDAGRLARFDFNGKAPPAKVWRSTSNPLLQHLVPNPGKSDAAQRGAETTGQMYVPQGFSIDVIAAEPDVHQPMAFTFDAKGRLWIVEGHSYPQKRPEGEGLDRVLIFSDDDGDGRFENRKVFIEGLNLVSGMQVGHGGVWIGAAPLLLFIPDADGDDRPDAEPQVLLDGFGLADTHETLNSFMWGPDGWLYGNQGVFNTSAIGKPGASPDQRMPLSAGVWRYHPTRHTFEVFAHGGSNQWGLDFDQHGQIFMTHCRSYWGQGLTTHVMQGGHYWNQVNGGYAAFISSQSPPGLPSLKNYLLASARYGHGEGGAGKAGSRVVYGGHSHVGTMIYLGDNWPAEFRNHLFTHNLHGHQLNHQVNLREAGGYNTVHAGSDVLFCGDQQYIGVDLQVGPDGAVYISDWYDPRHCHNPNTELWDRGNGRMYRMKYDANYRVAPVDYLSATDAELVAALLHPNDWHARTAQRVLGERAAAGNLSASIKPQLMELATGHPEATIRLRGVWSLHAMGATDDSLTARLLEDPSEYVRAWAIQLACESHISPAMAAAIVEHAQSESSLFVRRYLESAMQRVPSGAAWQIAETLAAQADNASDRDLPLLLWQGLAPLIDRDLERGLQLADATPLSALQDYVLWYAAKTSGDGRTQLAQRLAAAGALQQPRLLKLFAHALRGMRGLTAPRAWSSIASGLYDSADDELRAAADALGAAFEDSNLFSRMRSLLTDRASSVESRRHALALLANDSSPENLAVFIELLDDAELVLPVLPLLRRFDVPEVSSRVLERLPNWEDNIGAAAMELLASRPVWANQLLDAIADGKIEKSRLTAYLARQMSNLGDELLNERLAQEWGNVGRSSAQLRDEIAKTASAFKAAPLWAYETREGAAHFMKLCAACHQPNQADERIAPKLEGTGSKGIDYAIENVIDPNAVIGRDFQARLVLTSDGQVLTGLVQSESESAIILKTATSSVTIRREDIDEIRVSENSFMPAGLLETLNDRERIELFKYLMAM